MKYDKSSSNNDLYDKILIITFFTVVLLSNSYWFINAFFPQPSRNQPKHLGYQGSDFVVCASLVGG